MHLLKCADYKSARIQSLTFHCTEKDAKMLFFLLYSYVPDDA